MAPQYGSPGAREQGIAAGAGRSAAELPADLDSSAAALCAETASLADADWAAVVHGMHGTGHPAWYTLWRRLSGRGSGAGRPPSQPARCLRCRRGSYQVTNVRPAQAAGPLS